MTPSPCHLKQKKPFPMNRVKPVLSLAFIIVLGVLFHNFSLSEPYVHEDCLELPSERFSTLHKNGKLVFTQELPNLFAPSEWEDLGFPFLGEDTKLALQHQLHVLEAGNFRDGEKVGNLEVTFGEFKEVIEILLQRVNSSPTDLHRYLEAHQVWGDDKQGNVYFTGYYTPALQVKKKKDKKYKYPLYAYPEEWEGPMPSRKEIDSEGALENKGLELAYATNPMDIYTMQLQGSGTVEFIDTDQRMIFQYAGENGHPYRNIQYFFKNRRDLSITNLSLDGMRRFLLKNPQLVDTALFYNPSYTFFEAKTGLVKGAGQVPLMEGISVAADPRYFPLGSVILAAVPVIEEGKVTHHEYKLLLPQDVGGAIKGAGHVDVYCGNGKLGKKWASSLHHYGQMWLLTPKNNGQVALNQ